MISLINEVQSTLTLYKIITLSVTLSSFFISIQINWYAGRLKSGNLCFLKYILCFQLIYEVSIINYPGISLFQCVSHDCIKKLLLIPETVRKLNRTVENCLQQSQMTPNKCKSCNCSTCIPAGIIYPPIVIIAATLTRISSNFHWYLLFVVSLL